MVEVELKPENFEGLQKLFKDSPEKLSRAIKRANKKAGNNIRARIIKSTTSRYFIKAQKLRSSMQITNYARMLHIVIWGRRQTLGSYYLSPRKRPKGRQHGIHGAVKRGPGKNFPHGFLLYDNVPFIRVGRGRKDIEPIYSPAVPEIVGSPENYQEIFTGAQEKYSEILQHEISYELGIFKV